MGTKVNYPEFTTDLLNYIFPPMWTLH